MPSFFIRSTSVLRFTPNRDAAPFGPLIRPFVSRRVSTILFSSSKLLKIAAASIAEFIFSGNETDKILLRFRITDRSIKFSNSRTLPGQDQR